MQQFVSATEFRDKRGRTVGRVKLVDVRRSPSIHTIDELTAAERGEELTQITEGHSYEYELEEVPSGSALEATSIVQPSRLRERVGRLEPGMAAGLLALHLVDKATGTDIGVAILEVRTNKIDYHTHYRTMLSDLAETATALLLDIKAPSQTRLVADRLDSSSAHEQFVVLRALLDRDELADAIARILEMPHRRWRSEDVRVDARRPFRASRGVVSQIARAGVRIPVSDAHPLSTRLRSLGALNPSLPAEFHLSRDMDTLDTPENRFVKYVLEEWESFLVTIADALSQSASASTHRVRREVEVARKRVSGWLGHGLFTEVTRLTALPLASPTLQRRPGYRELLHSWLSFRAGTALSWAAGVDVFGGGNKDVALLYEYWVFFELLGVVEGLFELETAAAYQLFTETADGLDLRLKAGEELSFSGRYTRGTRPLAVRFSYNRTFRHAPYTTRTQVNYPAAGSWTKPMRPDYTLSLWPSGFGELEAERQELVTHVHFDAKYRVDDLTQLFGSSRDDDLVDLDDEKRASRTNQVAKRADLLKMHAYRDAIRRTEGAYVIYPGTDPVESQEWWAFHELLPGLGAFALRPGAAETSRSLLRDFLESIADFACDEATRLDQLTYHTFRIQEATGWFRSKPHLPPEDGSGRRLRKRPRIES